MKPNIFADINNLLSGHKNIISNPARKKLIKDCIDRQEAAVSSSGALSTWTPTDSTGRSPQNTYIVKNPESQHKIDWTSSNNKPLDKAVFDYLFSDAIKILSGKKNLYLSCRSVCADVRFAYPIKVLTDRALTTLFGYNMFRPLPKNINKSVFRQDEFILLALPYDKIRKEEVLKKFGNIFPQASRMIIAMDMDRKLGLVYGSSYLGSVKKLIFTVMNFFLPEQKVMPLHCAANEDNKGETALFLGLSGTGKTTLSTDPGRKLIGDDEHAWTKDGIANYEYGCYAKLINLDPLKEPEIYKAVFTKRHHLDHGCIVENAMMYPDGLFDLYDDRLTQNSRVSYPIEYLSNTKKKSLGGHPKTIIFLTADAHGVLPPVAKLDTNQALLWFLMGYTCKLAGTETGVVSPRSTFSRFFGEPFMPRIPGDYLELFGEKIRKYKTRVFLVNTGWTGGPYGTGKRMDINVTRKIIDAALTGKLDNGEYSRDKRFKFFVAKNCPGVDAKLLDPKNTWTIRKDFEIRANTLAKEFNLHFAKAYSKSNIKKELIGELPQEI